MLSLSGRSTYKPILGALLTTLRLQEETARVEEHLLDGSFTQAIIRCFTTSKANAFENLLEPLQKLLRLSPPVASSLAHPDLFSRILQKLQSNKAVVRLNLLRIIRSICDASEEQGSLLTPHGLTDTIQRLAEVDGAILVRNMATELIKSSDLHEKLGLGSGKRRGGGRRQSSTTTPPSLLSSQSLPPTPSSARSCTKYYNDRPRTGVNGSTPLRPPTRDGTPYNGSISSITSANGAAKSRLPRTTSRQGGVRELKGENEVPKTQTPNSRRRRGGSGEVRWS